MPAPPGGSLLIAKGYAPEDLEEAWNRYLPPAPPVSIRYASAGEGVETRKNGRGLRIVEGLCEEVTFNEAGNRVRVVYRW